MNDIGIPEKNRNEIVTRLSVLLANEFVLYIKTLNYHWNVIDSDFGALHKFFEEQYEDLFKMIDATAERITALGHRAPGSFTEFIQYKTLSDDTQINIMALSMISNLLNDHEVIIKQLRQDIDLTMELNDAGTNNFLADLIEKHEKMAWMLRAHIS